MNPFRVPPSPSTPRPLGEVNRTQLWDGRTNRPCIRALRFLSWPFSLVDWGLCWLTEKMTPASPRAIRASRVVLCLSMLGLLTLGFVMLASTSSFVGFRGDSFYYAKRQGLWLMLGLAGCGAAAWLNYQQYRKYAWPLLVIALIGLVAVLIFGRRINGALRWLVFGPVRLQPSEFAKYVVVIFLAYWLEKMQRASKGQLRPRIQHWWWGVFAPLAVTGVVAVLVLKEPDLGTTMLLFGVALVMLWLAGAPWGWLAGIVAVAALVVAAALVAIFQFGMFHEYYQVQRLIHWWVWDDLDGINYQQNVGMQALGHGGPLGVGLGNSWMKRGFLPEAHTDFIFPIVGEELGLVATLVVAALFCLVVIGGFLLVTRSPDMFGRLLGSGILAVIGLQALINMAVVTNMIPNKGMALPFISYGGSNLVMTLTAVGVLLNISRHGLARAQENVAAQADAPN